MITIKKGIKYIMTIIHYFIVLFITFGAFLPKKYLIFFVFAWPILYLHWYTNNDRCFFTQIECWLDKQPYCSKPAAEYPFVTKMLSYVNIEIKSKQHKKYAINAMLSFFWLIGIYRYFN